MKSVAPFLHVTQDIPQAPPQLARVHSAIVSCERCPRLRAYCERVARRKSVRIAPTRHWGRPVPGFGDPGARLLLVGLAPAAHGANRTGRPFTGDGSGDFLMSALHRTGFSNIATSQTCGRRSAAAGCVHFVGGALCTAGQQTTARRDRALPRSPRRRDWRSFGGSASSLRSARLGSMRGYSCCGDEAW